MKPSRGLRRDPAKVRSWQRRARAASSLRSGHPTLGRKTELRPISERQRARKKAQRAAEGPLEPREWRLAVAAAAELRCRVTSAEASHALDRRFHAHHPFPKDELRSRGLYGWVWDPRNGAFVLARVHFQHEAAMERIPRAALPASVWEFCAELDAIEGRGWATAKVEAAHPA